MDEELERVRSLAAHWLEAWHETSLRERLTAIQRSPVIEALASAPEPAAEPIQVLVALPTSPAGLNDPLAELQTLAWVSRLVEQAKTEIVAECRHRGRSWSHIGDALGVARQSAWTKYGTELSDVG